MPRGLAVAVLGVAGCTAIADFPADRLVEQTDGLCNNGVDDDADGLTDCQDWKCLEMEACCNVPAIVLVDAFEGCSSDACDLERRDECAPDEDLWERWGAPYPYVCEGGLRLGKDELCYDVGVRSRSAVTLEPSVRLEADVVGTLEPAAAITIGWTLESSVVDGGDPCAQIAPAPTLFTVVAAPADDGGIRFVARMLDEDIGVIEPPSQERHEVDIEVLADRSVRFVVDELEIATTTGDLLVEPIDAYVILRGTGSDAQLDDVEVVAGTQCDRPEAWTMATPFAPLDPQPGERTWDHFDRSYPSAWLDDEGSAHLLYNGCMQADSPICDPFTIAIGEAIAVPGQPFEREPGPRFQPRDLEGVGTEKLDFTVLPDADEVWFTGEYFSEASRGVGRVSIAPNGAFDTQAFGSDDVFSVGATESWRRFVGRPSVIDTSEGRFLWYAACDCRGDPRVRIALSITERGTDFVATSEAVLDVGGAPGEERAVIDPAVIYDAARGLFRMWYAAFDTFDRSSIRYAVSVDGEHWQRYPGNPVIRPEDLGLVSIGSPTVIDDDGRLRMWIHGVAPGANARSIYELQNVGAPFGSP